MDFVSKYEILGLAVGFIIGLYLGTLVRALVKDLILPIIGLPCLMAFVIFLLVKAAKRWGVE